MKKVANQKRIRRWVGIALLTVLVVAAGCDENQEGGEIEKQSPLETEQIEETDRGEAFNSPHRDIEDWAVEEFDDGPRYELYLRDDPTLRRELEWDGPGAVQLEEIIEFDEDYLGIVYLSGSPGTQLIVNLYRVIVFEPSTQLFHGDFSWRVLPSDDPNPRGFEMEESKAEWTMEDGYLLVTEPQSETVLRIDLSGDEP